MKITFVSNYLSHHQTPFSDAISNMQEVEYSFVSVCAMDNERQNMGWKDIRKPYEIRTYVDRKSENKAIETIDNSDVVILGSAPDSYVIPRLKEGKLTFKYSERFYKRGLTVRNFPHAIAGAWLHHGRFQKYPLYMLCASAYTAADAAVFHNYIGRTYKWGYFPEVKHYDIETLMSQKQGLKLPCASILWAGRLIGWKHPDASILLAETLKREGYQFKLSIIGNGHMEQELHMMISEKGLEDCVEMLGAMSPEQVREYMEESDIFLFTSDFNEGWGAVLNESMNSGCAVVASHAIGSVPFLIRDGENGLIYQNGSQKHLEKQVKLLLADSAYRKKLGENAYRTITELWSADVAAKRFVELSEHMLNGEKNVSIFENGPCSKAEILNNNWFQGDVK